MNAGQPQFDQLQGVLVRHHAVAGVAEAHGVLAGALCAAPCSFDDWVAEILPDGKLDGPGGVELHSLFDATRGAFDEYGFAFMPLLPADDAPLVARTQALAEWCRGFLYGLGSGYLPQATARDADVAEVLQDLAQISRAEVDADDEGEGGEQAYAELVEYVRVGVHLLHAHLAPLRSRPQPVARETLH